MTKTHIVHGSRAYESLFRDFYEHELVSDIDKADLIVFTGGEDVTPQLYGEEPHPTTYFSVWRDERETEVFAYARQKNIPLVGICRGGQFLNVLCGGRMYQDVTNHTRSHDITDLATGETFFVTSTHHQMMRPAKNAEILAVANFPSQREWMDGEIVARDESNTGIEVVLYRNQKVLCFQPHPEIGIGQEVYNPMRRYFRSCLDLILEPQPA